MRASSWAATTAWRRGTWEMVELPFGHVLSFADGRVKSVHNVLDGFELRRLPATASRAAS